MKRICIAIFFLASCTNTPDKIVTAPPGEMKNMKGFEIYIFEKHGKLIYTLLPGTNRNKTMDEVYDDNNAVEGLDSIRMKAADIARGEYVMIKPVGVDSTRLAGLKDYLLERGLRVTIAKQTGF